MWETAGSISEEGEGGLQMHGTRIVDGGVDPARFESGAHGIAPLNVNHEQVVHPFIARIIRMNLYAGALQQAAVNRGDFPAAGVLLLEPL